jgi:hypothetical protein
LRNVGWVWVPGDEWAPAWVSWRKGGDYVGWAPLPPEARFEHGSGIHSWADNYYDIGPDQYAFVSTRDFGNERIDRSLVPSDRNVTIVDQTTNVTNITYNNTTVVNEGPNFEEIRSHSGRPIERLRLQRQVTADFGSNDPRTVVRGEIVEMPAPVIARAQPVDRPRNLKQNVLQAVVDHGWENITDRQAAERIRVKMKREATPPPNAPSRTFEKPPPAQAAATTTASAPPASAVATATPAASATPAVTAVATATPVATPPRRRLPAAALPVVTPTATAETARTAAPAATVTATPATSPSPARSTPPAPSSPAASAVPSATSETTTSVPPAQFGRGNAKQERRAEREQRREQSVEPELSGTPPMSPATSSTNSTPATPASASPPDNAGSPSLSRKEQKKEQRRARRAGEPEETPTPSP